MFQLYRGERTFYQYVFVSPRMLVVSLRFSSQISSLTSTNWLHFVGLIGHPFPFFWQGRSLRFSGYQIAHTIIGESQQFYFIWISYSVEWLLLSLFASLLSLSSSSSTTINISVFIIIVIITDCIFLVIIIFIVIIIISNVFVIITLATIFISVFSIIVIIINIINIIIILIKVYFFSFKDSSVCFFPWWSSPSSLDLLSLSPTTLKSSCCWKALKNMWLGLCKFQC